MFLFSLIYTVVFACCIVYVYLINVLTRPFIHVQLLFYYNTTHKLIW